MEKVPEEPVQDTLSSGYWIRGSGRAGVRSSHSPPARVGGSPARQRKRGSVSPPPRAPCAVEVSAKKRVKEAAVSAAAAGRGADYGEVCAGCGRVPRKGDVVECEMTEPSAPGGVEWLAGEVVRVDVRKKEMTVRIQDEKEDEITSNEENYKVPCNDDVCAFFLASCLLRGHPARALGLAQQLLLRGLSARSLEAKKKKGLPSNWLTAAFSVQRRRQGVAVAHGGKTSHQQHASLGVCQTQGQRLRAQVGP